MGRGSKSGNTPKSGNKPENPKFSFRFLGYKLYTSAGLHFQDPKVGLNDSAVKNGWGKVFTNIFRHKQGSNEQKTENYPTRILKVVDELSYTIWERSL